VRLFAVPAAGLLILSAAGCGSSDTIDAQHPNPPGHTSSNAPSDPAPSSSSTPSAREQVLRQYRAFWRALPNASAAKPNRRRAILSRYAANGELKTLLKGMAKQERKGQSIYGKNIPHPTIQTLSVKREIAVINDCQDSSHSGIRDDNGGHHVTVGVSNNPVVTTMQLGTDGVWRVTFVRYPENSC
jgi:hypothetical protein